MAKRSLMMLLKAFRKEQWAQEFLDGDLYCNTLRFYQNWENKRLRDKNEGVIVLPGANLDLRFGDFRFPKGDVVSLSYRPNLMNYIYVYCMYCWVVPWIDDNLVLLNKETQLGSLRNLEHSYGPNAVMIRDLPEFFRRINQAVNHPSCGVLQGKGDTIKYKPMLALPSTSEQTIQAAFHKDSKYIGEQEYRFAFLLERRQREGFRLKIGSIRDIAAMVRTSDIFDSIKVNGQTDF